MAQDRTVSKQIDVIVYDRLTAAPLYKDPGFVILTDGMPRLALESKLVLNKKDLAAACENLRSVKQLNHRTRCLVWAYSGMTSSTLETHLRSILAGCKASLWPDQIYNLHRNYVAARKEGPAFDREWTVLTGKTVVVASLLQEVVSSAGARNLRDFAPSVPGKDPHSFTIGGSTDGSD